MQSICKVVQCFGITKMLRKLATIKSGRRTLSLFLRRDFLMELKPSNNCSMIFTCSTKIDGVCNPCREMVILQNRRNGNVVDARSVYTIR